MNLRDDSLIRKSKIKKFRFQQLKKYKKTIGSSINEYRMDQTIRNIIKSTQRNKNYKEQYDSYFEPNLTFILKMFVVRYILRSIIKKQNKMQLFYSSFVLLFEKSSLKFSDIYL